MPESLYAILEVEESADPATLRRAFMQGAQRWHPDKAPEGEQGAYESRFQRMSQAYETLSDPQRRRRYDDELRWQRRPRTAYAERPDFTVRDAERYAYDFRWRDMGAAETRSYTSGRSSSTWTAESMDPKEARRVVRNLQLWGGLGIILVVMGALIFGFFALLFGIVRLMVQGVAGWFGLGRRAARRV